MKTLTKGQRFALAREARRLAMECVKGTAPELLAWPDCAAGVAIQRAGLYAGTHQWPSLCELFDVWRGTNPFIVVANANDHAPVTADRPARVVFPLLALADALEASAASVPQAPPEVP